MKSKTTSKLAGIALSFLVLSVQGMAQQPSSTPAPKTDNTAANTGDNAGDFLVTSSIEFGYRGLSVDGDHNKYRSDLNYDVGPRLFDSTFFMKSQDGKTHFLDTLLFTTTGWGADPSGNLRINAENSHWFRFDGTYRKFKYFRYLNSFANPNWVFSPANFSVPPKPTTGEHGNDSETKLGDFDLTLLPKNRLIRFNVGYSLERFDGDAFTNYHLGGNEFNYPLTLRSRANDYRFGVEGTVAGLDYSFLQGFRRFRDDTFNNLGITPGINLDATKAQLTSFNHNEPTRGSVNFTRASLHTLVAKRLDVTGRVVYSKTDSDFTFVENFTGTNFNARVSGWPPGPQAATPNVLNLGQYNITGSSDRPSWVGDIGATWLATDRFRISNTFRVEDFKIDGDVVFADFFSLTRPTGATTTRTDSIAFNNLDAHTHVGYRKYQNTIEGDYQFNPRYAVHLGYRYGHRRIDDSFEGYNLGSNGSVPPPTRSSSSRFDENNTHAILGGFKARPANNFTIYFDAEKGTADNVFTRIGNYDYTNIRAKTHYAPSKNLSFNVAFISRDNANPSEIAGVSLQDFGVSTKSRVFTSSVDWTPNNKFNLNTGYNYNWLNSNSVINYFFNNIQHPEGRSLYYVRNNFFFIDTTFLIVPRATLFLSYRINKDGGQGTRIATAAATPGFLVTSYPNSFQSPETRLAIKLHRRLDWNVGYQYYNYNESTLVGPRPQNYHAHLPYTSLRFYFGRKE